MAGHASACDYTRRGASDLEGALAGLVIHSLASGSSGNALLVEAGDTSILIDCGISGARLSRGLRALGRAPADLTAVLVSHEHVDHVRGITPLLRAKLPIVTTRGTAQAAEIAPATAEAIRAGSEIQIGSVGVVALHVSHDAAEPVGFMLHHPLATLTVVTDLGCTDDALIEPLAVSDVIVLEANHDLDMLWRGPYPFYLKRRVASPTGHLSNDDCAALLQRALARSDRTPTIWLAHLSETNNRPDLAVATVATALQDRLPSHRIRALPRRDPIECWRSPAVEADPPRLRQLSLFD